MFSLSLSLSVSVCLYVSMSVCLSLSLSLSIYLSIYHLSILEWVAISFSNTAAAAAAAASLQSCPTLCNPIDGLLPGSSVPGILQARTLESVAISFSNE